MKAVRAVLPALSYHADLSGLEEELEVGAVFPHTWHLRARDGSTATISAGPWNGPLTVRVGRRSLEGLSVRPGMPARLRNGAVVIAAVTVALRSAVSWAPVRTGAPVFPMALGDDVETAVERACAVDRGGLGAMGLRLHAAARRPGRAGRPGFPGGDREEPAWLQRGWAEIAGLSNALAVDDEAALARHARGLLGLGPGLTPSGDDVLCGLLAGLHILGGRAPRLAARCTRLGTALAAAVLPESHRRTTALSRTLLRYAHGGVAAEPLLDVLSTLGSGAPIEGLPALLAMGHSSGSDMLTGALLAGTAVLRWEEAFGPALVRSP